MIEISPTGIRSRSAGNYFDELYAKLKPECEALIGLYEDSRSALIPMAHLFQEHEGYDVAQRDGRDRVSCSKLPLAVVESTISFYTLFYRRPVGKYMLQVCRNLSCIINGAEEIMAYFREQLGIGHLETTADGLFSYEEVECLAACDRAPCMQVNLRFMYDLTPKMIDDMLAAMRAGTYDVKPLPADEGARTQLEGRGTKPAANRPAASAFPIPTTPAASATAAASSCSTASSTTRRSQRARTNGSRTNRNCGPRPATEDTTSMAQPRHRRSSPQGIGELNLRDIEVYRSTGGYAQLERAVKELGQKAVMDMCDGLEPARPRRRRFPDRPQVVVLAQQRPAALPRVQLRRGRTRHVQRSHAARADAASDHRGHPDRRVRDRLPSRVHLHSRRVQGRLRDHARGGARKRARPATSARASAAATTISSSRSTAAPARTSAARRPGCSTRSKASAASRGSSRRSRRSRASTANRPSSTTSRRWPICRTSCATAPEWFAKAGPERSPGFKVVSISGHVKKPGNYEVPLGTTIRQLIDDCAGGLRDGRTFLGVQPGGGSSACLFEEHLDLSYDFDTIAKAGSMLGSGAMVVFDDTTDFVKAAHALIRFYAHESCGQCTPCREGGQLAAEDARAHARRPRRRLGHRHAQVGLRTRSPG